MRQGWRDKPTDVVRRHRPDYMIILYTGILMLLGLVVIYAIGPQRANVLNNAVGSNYSDTYFFIKQTTSLLLALGAFAIMATLPYSFVVKHGLKVLILGLAACTLLAVASVAGWGIAANVNGATRWFDLGALGSFQPAEILKFGLLLYLAVFLGARVKEGKVNSLKETLIPVGIMTAIALLFIVEIQQDLGTGIALTAIVLTMLFVGGVSKKVGLIILALVLVVGVVLIMSAPHRINRVLTYLKGDNTSTDDPDGYHIQQAKIAIGTGFLFGVGIGNSVQATGYLPEAINDSVFAIMGETFGFFGLLALMAVFVALLLRLLKVMDHLVDIHLKLLVAGVFGWFGAHVILNIAAMIGIFPLTGITLPLLSFGGTSMIFITAALGLVFQLSRYTIHSSRIKESSHENSGSGRRLGRTRYPSRSGS
ncbi:MAG: FtsW/RodA/SpoVE family cell cycle protein [Candidatus Microsaccharimonas sp.]